MKQNQCKVKNLNREKIEFSRCWAMPNHKTFEIKPIKELINKEILEDRYILEPFPFEAKIDCFDYFDTFQDESMMYGLIDPPYTNRQVSEHYKKNGGKVTGWHTSSGWIKKVKDEVARIISPGGKVITFGYNSCGIGIKRGFKITKILMVCHGGAHYDTICTVEEKPL